MAAKMKKPAQSTAPRSGEVWRPSVESESEFNPFAGSSAAGGHYADAEETSATLTETPPREAGAERPASEVPGEAVPRNEPEVGLPSEPVAARHRPAKRKAKAKAKAKAKVKATARTKTGARAKAAKKVAQAARSRRLGKAKGKAKAKVRAQTQRMGRAKAKARTKSRSQRTARGRRR